MKNQETFSDWSLSEETQKSIANLGYLQPTPVQRACIPHLLTESTDLLALARTGTGKTAAFGIPLIEKLTVGKTLQALVLCPTRELAAQVSQSLQGLGLLKGLKVATVLGGESYHRQIEALRKGPQILVSTPGRLIDLMEQGIVNLDTVQYLILDEADEMLSFGFKEALETIWESIDEENAKTWLFSATMSDSIKRLANKYLKKPHTVSLVESAPQINVTSYAAVVYEEHKEDALALLIQNNPEFYGIIFATTKKQVADLEVKFKAMGLKVDSLHGDKAQADRSRVLARMKKRDVQILVATDVAARGLDIEDLTHVVNFEMPWDVETYTHRIGRTARAGKQGVVWTLVRPKDVYSLRKFERALKFTFQNLEIPSIEEVRFNQRKSWLLEMSSMVTSEHELMETEQMIEELGDQGVIISKDMIPWLVKIFRAAKIGGDISFRQPTSFDLGRAPQYGRDRGDLPPPRGGGPRRPERSRRGEWSDRPNRRPRREDSSEERHADSRKPRGEGRKEWKSDRPAKSGHRKGPKKSRW